MKCKITPDYFTTSHLQNYQWHWIADSWQLLQYISCCCTSVEEPPLICVCACMDDAPTATDWTVVSQAISLCNGSTRHCVSQHYSWGCRYVPSSSLHPRLSLCLMDSFPQTHTYAYTHTRSHNRFLSVLVLVSSFHTQKWLHTRVHTHARALVRPGANSLCAECLLCGRYWTSA